MHPKIRNSTSILWTSPKTLNLRKEETNLYMENLSIMNTMLTEEEEEWGTKTQWNLWTLCWLEKKNKRVYNIILNIPSNKLFDVYRFIENTKYMKNILKYML